MPTEFGGKLLPEIRAKLEVSRYRRMLWVGLELFIVTGGFPKVPIGVRTLNVSP